MRAHTQHCVAAAVNFNGRDSYSESRILKVGIFPGLSAMERERGGGWEGEKSTFLLEIKPNCPFSLVVP